MPVTPGQKYRDWTGKTYTVLTVNPWDNTCEIERPCAEGAPGLGTLTRTVDRTHLEEGLLGFYLVKEPKEN